MARSLTEIYNVAKQCRVKYLEQTEQTVENSSKMSVIDAFTWTVSASIWAFENLLDVFKVDLAKDLMNRINGTPEYFSNALLKYQDGDELVVSEDGVSFSYANENVSKRIIKKVSYYEMQEEGFYDKMLVFKIAGVDESGKYTQIETEKLIGVQTYLERIMFAGQHAVVVSRRGDVLIPRLTVYYDGKVPASTVSGNIKNALEAFIASTDFNGIIYVQKIIDAIQSAEHVVDVDMDNYQKGDGGIFVAQYDDDNKLINEQAVKVNRYFIPDSGYLRESTGKGDESKLEQWASSILLKVEDAK